MSRNPTITPARRKRAAQRFADALALQRAGNLAGAEQGFRQVVAGDPGHAPALHCLALLRHRQGALAEAIGLMQRGADGHDADASLLNNLGNMLREAGRADEAIGAYRRALALDGGNVNARFNLARLLLDAGDAAGARTGFESVLQVTPGDVAALNGLALALLGLGDAPGAVARLREAVAAAPGDAAAAANLARALLAADRASESLDTAREAEARFPGDLRVLNALAGAQITLEMFGAAEATLRRVLERDPHDLEAWVALARALVEQRREREAVDLCDACIARLPGRAEANGSKGIALKQLGRLEEAVREFERAIELNPRYAAAWNNLGMTLIDLGETARAEASFTEALALEPDQPEALFNVIRTRRNGPEHAEEIRRIESLADAGRLTPAERVSLHFALGKAFDDLGDFDRAFGHYDRANALKRRSVSFVPEKFLEWVQGFHDTFTAEYFRRTRGFGADSERPVFIVGMPRSGTTLVEQILASHPDVHGADELTLVGELADSLPARLATGGTYPRAAAALDRATAAALAGEYLAHIAALDPHAARVTDKMPSNFFHLGLIAAMLPRARIVHCTRDPMDACFSNFIQQFGDAHFYSYSLDHIAVYFREYQRVMAHWRAVLPLPLHEVSYEALVDAPERETRAMLEHLGLPFDAACLEFHRTRRAVRTASHWQVRQPIYRSARQRWRRYARHLEGLAAQIGYTDPAPP